MVSLVHLEHLDDRQLLNDPLNLPTVEGISGVKTASAFEEVPSIALTDVDGDTQLAGAPTAAGVVGDTPITIGRTTPTSAPGPAVSASGAAVTASGSNERFSIGMVAGICIGAFFGCAVIIGIGILLYRRSAPKPQRRPSHSRSRSGKVEGGDNWEGKYPETRQVQPNSASTLQPMEKMTMFSSTPSVRSDGSGEPTPNFNEYHPGLAKELATDSTAGGTKPFLANVDTGATLSWNSSAFASSDTGRMSPMFSKAIPTPSASDSPLHHAQSAEIINPFDDDAVQQDEAPRKSSIGNPFFGSRSQAEVTRKASRASASRASVASSRYTDYVPAPRSDKGKARALASSHGHGDVDDMYADSDDEDGYYSTATNPFSDPSPRATPTPATPHQHHPYAAPIFQTSAPSPAPSSPRKLPATPSPSGTPVPPENDARIQGLLAALAIPSSGDLSADAAGRNTVMSTQSAYSDIETGTAGQFPAPPGNSR